MLEDDFNELVDYVVELKNQYQGKIDEQSQRINEQMAIIDELCCQMRELGARVRTLTTRMENKSEFCVCNYENHSVRSSEKNYRVNGSRLGDDESSLKSETKKRWEDTYELALDDITKNTNYDDDEENIYEAIDLLSNKSSTLPPVFRIAEGEIAEPTKVSVITVAARNNASNDDAIEQVKDTTNNGNKRLINKTLPREATASVIFVPNEDTDEGGLKKTQGLHDLRHLIEEAELRTDKDRISSKVATCSLTSEAGWKTSSPGSPGSCRERLNNSSLSMSERSPSQCQPLLRETVRVKSLLSPKTTLSVNSFNSQKNQTQSGIWMRSNILS